MVILIEVRLHSEAGWWLEPSFWRRSREGGCIEFVDLLVISPRRKEMLSHSVTWYVSELDKVFSQLCTRDCMLRKP